MRAGITRGGRAALIACVVAVAARSGAQTFGPTLDVSGSADGSYLPSLVRDRGGPSAGSLRVFWHDFTVAPNQVWCADDTTGAFNTWGPCAATGQSWSPRAATDGAGVTHLVWRQRVAGQDEILHATHDGATWSAPVNLSNSPGASRNPAIAIDPWDRPHVAWEEDPGTGVRFFEAHFDGTSWTPAADTGLPYAAATHLDTLRLACDGAGTLHAVWHDGATSATEVFHSSRPDGGTWSAPENLSDTPGDYSTEPAIAVSAGDAVLVAWAEQVGAAGAASEICLAVRPAGGSWLPRQEITSLRSNAFRPSVAVGSDDVPRIAFSSGSPGDRDVLYLAAPTATPVDVSASPGVDSDRASLILDDLDRPSIAWQEGSLTGAEILLVRPHPGGPILLRVRRAGADVVLHWSGGAPPHRVLRETAPDAPPPWTELTPAGGIAAATWTDRGVSGDGRALYYLIE